MSIPSTAGVVVSLAFTFIVKVTDSAVCVYVYTCIVFWTDSFSKSVGKLKN